MSHNAQAGQDEQHELSYGQALQLAMQMHRAGRLAEAEPVYRALLELSPDDPNVVHFLGVLLHQRHGAANDEALALVERSVALDPSVAAWHNNLGNLLLERRRLDEATDAYARCHQLDPGNVEVLNNLGVLRGAQRRYELAEQAFQQAIARKPDFADAHANLAGLYHQLRRTQECLHHSAEAIRLRPAHPAARRVLGMLYARLGRMEEAAQVFRDWLALEPGNEQALHHLAACGGAAAPERASDGYVREVFDRFADSFDAKLSALKYQAPELVGRRVQQLLGASQPVLHVLDAGCGTGLCGPWLKPFACRLEGVDLSANMLAKARGRGEYDALHEAELVAHLRSLRAGSVDLLVSADTLCYFGALDGVFGAAAHALTPGAHLVFTVESHDGDAPFRLHPHGRYSHQHDYLTAELQRAGLLPLALEPVVLRHEVGEPVHGWLASARKPSA